MVHEHISCMVGWTTGTQDSRRTAQRIYLCRFQHRCGYEQHTITPPDNNFTQIPGALQEQYAWTEQVFVNGQNRFVTIPPGRSSMCLNGIEIGCGQPQIPTVELNMDGLLEYQERRQCVTSKKKEPLTPAQRRRKAQNRIAYVSGSPILPNDSCIDTSRYV